MTIEIPLSKTGKHAGKYVAIVDDIDADLAELNWSVLVGRTTYAVHTYKKNGVYGTLFLHRIILERKLGKPLPEGMQADHINRDSLLNTRDNLRPATHSQNRSNTSRPKNNKSGYKGVSYVKKYDRWRAVIFVGGKQTYLGHFTTPEAAHEAYKAAAIKYRGEFANGGES